VLLAVDRDYYSILSSEVGVHTVTANITNVARSVSWSVTAVYGPQSDSEKLQFMGELRWVSMAVMEKWIVIGDFNLILQAEDKSNTNLNRRLMGAFRDLVNDLELKELSLTGRKYTWSNERTHSRIDRAFCSTDWDLMLPNVNLQALSSRVSDHSPLLVVGSATVNKYKGFRFEAFWPRLPGYDETVADAWTKEVRVTNPFLRLHTKLQRSSRALRAWAKKLIGNNKLLIVAAIQLIGCWM
jgi:hypothetical protein